MINPDSYSDSTMAIVVNRINELNELLKTLNPYKDLFNWTFTASLLRINEKVFLILKEPKAKHEESYKQ